MKLYPVILFFLLLLTLIACKNYSNETQTDSLVNNAASVTDKSHEKGARLIASNDCLTCHSLDKKNFGPSYLEIAERYHHKEKLAEYLVNSVIKGSKGVFGDKAMTPHPTLNYNDIIEMNKFILSLTPHK